MKEEKKEEIIALVKEVLQNKLQIDLVSRSKEIGEHRYRLTHVKVCSNDYKCGIHGKTLLEHTMILRGEGVNQYHALFNILTIHSYHIHISFNIMRTYIVHQAFYMETQNERKPHNSFLILKQNYIHLIYQYQLTGGYNPLVLPAPTGRKHQLPSFTSNNWKEAPNSLSFTSTN